jgi:DNA-directed RNA polymerase specialized sigma24 family protein
MTGVCFEDCQDEIFREAARQAKRLAHRLRLQPADLDDVFQDIVSDAWRRLRAYRSCRGDLDAFLAVITLHQARKVEARFRQRWRVKEVSLDAPIGSDDAGTDPTLADNLSEDEGLPAALGNFVDGHARIEKILDLSRAIASLQSDMRQLCGCLAHEAPGTARRICGLSNTGMYRRIEELRLHFRTFGLETS